jgi:hypothetical protein
MKNFIFDFVMIIINNKTSRSHAPLPGGAGGGLIATEEIFLNAFLNSPPAA